MAKKQFTPLTLELIDEGRFLKDMNSGIASAMRALIAWKSLYGKDAAVGTKSTLKCTLTLCFDGRSDDDFSIKGVTSLQVPGPPARVSVAIEGEEQDGERTLFVCASGGRPDSPLQGVIATHDGRTVDPKTGDLLK